MSLQLVVGEDFPTGLWMLDGADGLRDYSGYGRTATVVPVGGVTPTLQESAALVKGASHSVLLGNGNMVSFDTQIYRKKFENTSWSIEVCVTPIRIDPDSTDPIQIMGNAGQMDGLTIVGTEVSFSTKYTNTGEAKCTFDIEDNRSFNVTGVHTPGKNMLYIDSDLVAEVDITSEQQDDTYLSNGVILSSGDTASENMIAVNGMATYKYALDEGTIFTHIDEGKDNLSEAAVAIAFGGSNLQLTPEESSPVLQVPYGGFVGWNSGVHNGTTVENTLLVPERDESGLTTAGEWLTSLILPEVLGTLHGVSITWAGTGMTVETSLDGEDWDTVVKGVNIPTISQGETGTIDLLVRVRFTKGLIEDSYFNDLLVSVYTLSAIPLFDGREILLDNGSIEEDHDTLDYHENWGVELNAGKLTVTGPEAGSINIRTIQFWARQSSDATFEDNMLSTAADTYTNDSALRPYLRDEWQLRTYVFENGYVDPIEFTGTGQIGTVSIYPDAFTPDLVEQSYLSYVGVPKVTFLSGGSIALGSPSDEVDVYEYDWTVATSV